MKILYTLKPSNEELELYGNMWDKLGFKKEIKTFEEYVNHHLPDSQKVLDVKHFKNKWWYE